MNIQMRLQRLVNTRHEHQFILLTHNGHLYKTKELEVEEDHVYSPHGTLCLERPEAVSHPNHFPFYALIIPIGLIQSVELITNHKEEVSSG